MVISSPYAIYVDIDHEALGVLLTGLDNNAHGRVAKWQERVGEYNYQLLHRSATAQFLGIANGLSRLPTNLMQRHFAEDSEGLWPRPAIIACGQAGIYIKVPVNAHLAIAYGDTGLSKARRREGMGVWVAVVLVGDPGGVVDSRERLEAHAKEVKKKKWQKWLDSRLYGGIG